MEIDSSRIEPLVQKLKANREGIKPEDMPKYKKAFEKLERQIITEVCEFMRAWAIGKEIATRDEELAFHIAVQLVSKQIRKGISTCSMVDIYKGIELCQKRYILILKAIKEFKAIEEQAGKEITDGNNKN